MPKNKLTLNDCVYLCLSEGGYWTFWKIQETILAKQETLYGEPSISAALRHLRKAEGRHRYGLPSYGPIVEMRKRQTGRGYEYKLNDSILENIYEQRKAAL